MATYDEVAAATINTNLAELFVWDGVIVKLTGRYACPTTPTASGLTLSVGAVAGSLHVEVKIDDKDTPIVKWMKFSDLKIVRTIAK